MPCRSARPVTGQSTGRFGVSCEIDSLCTTGKCRRVDLGSIRTGVPVLEGRQGGWGGLVHRSYHGVYAPKDLVWRKTAGSNHPTCAKKTTRELITYKITNFLGLSDKTGKRKKQITKQARAPKLQAPKINSRSHLLTIAPKSQLFSQNNDKAKNQNFMCPHSPLIQYAER